jgi:hypothetical protein
MSLLNNKKELKEAALQLPYSQLVIAADVLNTLINQRSKEADVVNQLQALAKSKGFSLAGLGFVATQVDKAPAERPVKPKFKTINADKQLFYFDAGEIRLLRTHTMKKMLVEQGFHMVPARDVQKEHAAAVQELLESATVQAVKNYNAKVDSWNAWASENGEEILVKR